MRADLGDEKERLERLVVNSDAAQGFELPSITHHGSTLMLNSPSQDVR